MVDMRPMGFRDYIKAHGYHTVYLLTPITGWPTKVGISEDPARRLGTIQAGHFDELIFHRFWWLPGIQIAARIESAFKKELAPQNIRGEWFRLSPTEAEHFIEERIRDLGVWSLTQCEMEHLQDAWVRKRYGLPRTAPSPLKGRPPGEREPWER